MESKMIEKATMTLSTRLILSACAPTQVRNQLNQAGFTRVSRTRFTAYLSDQDYEYWFKKEWAPRDIETTSNPFVLEVKPVFLSKGARTSRLPPREQFGAKQ